MMMPMAWRLLARSRLRNRLRDEQIKAALIAGISASLMTAGTEEEFSRIMRDDIAPAFGGDAIILAYAEHDRWRVPRRNDVAPLLSRRKHGQKFDADNPSNDALRSGGPLFASSRTEFHSRWPDWSGNFEWTRGKAFGVVPIGTLDSPLASMGLDYNREYRPNSADLAFFGTLQRLAVQALARIRLHCPRTDLACSLRQNVVPPLFDPLPGLDIAARYQSAINGLDLGGDWYDAFEMADGTVGLVMGDIQGHDVHAAAFMGQVRASIRALAFADGDPGVVLARANDLLCATTADRFASCSFLRYNPSTMTVQVANAGHIPAAWIGPGGSRGLMNRECGPVLGVLPHVSYPVQSMRLNPGSLIILVTDGVVEGPDQSLERGMKHLGALGTEALANGNETEEIADRLMTMVNSTGHLDDAALLVARTTTPQPHKW